MAVAFPVPGKKVAIITKKSDLFVMGFARDPHIRENSQFQDLVKQMKFKI